MKNKKLNTTTLLFFILLKFVLQYIVINPVYDLHRDEYLHLDQADHLAWGFISVPPLTSIIALLIKWLGNDVFWVKFFPALSGALVIYIVWRLIENLGGGLYAQILAAMALLFSVLLRLNTLFQPNSIDIFCWTMSFYLIVRYIQTDKSKYLIWLGLTFGIGFLNKYNIAFLLLGLIPALLLTEQRKLFLDKYFYAAIIIFLLIIALNLYWQFSNDWPVVRHMQDLSATQLVNVNRLDFIKEQLLFFIGACYLVLLSFWAFWQFEPFKKYRIIFWNFIFTITLFIYFKAKGYYAIGLYPILIGFGSVYIEHLLSEGWKKKLRLVFPVIILLMFLPFYDIAFPILPPEEIKLKTDKFKKFDLLRWEDGKDHEMPQDFADMLGWSELAEKVDRQYAVLPEKNKTIVICDNYGQAGAINYYSSYKNISAVSFNADYINWFPLENEIKNIILVKDMEDTDKERKDEQPYFESIVLADSITHPFAREKGTRIYLLKNAKVDINSFLKKEIKTRIETQKNF